MPPKRTFHWPFVPRRPDLGQSGDPVDSDFRVPAPRDFQPASAISQSPVVYTGTLLRAEGSICLLFKKQHLFVFVLWAMYL